MKPFRLPGSLLWKIALPNIGLVALLLIGISLYLSAFLRDAYIGTLRSRLEAEARQLAPAATAVLADSGGAENWARESGAALGVRITLIQPDGVVIGDSEANPVQMDNHLMRPEVQLALATGNGFEIRPSATLGVDMLYVAARVDDSGRTAGILRLAIPLSQVDSTTSRLQAGLFTAIAAATLFFLIASIWVARRVSGPIDDLTEAARRVTSGDLETTLIPIGTDEIAELTIAFNAMTSRLRAQFDALRAESGKLSAVLTQMTDGVIILNPKGEITLLNPAAEHLFGVDHSDAIGHSAAEIIRQYQLLDLINHCRAEGKPASVTLEFGSDKLFLHAMALPLGEALPGSLFLLVQDLTRLRRLETVRRDFISNLSHELRTPLAALRALAETLQERALDDPVAARRFLDLMETELATLDQMSGELLELAQIESGKVPLAMQSVSPTLLLQDASDRFHLQAERAGLRLTSEIGADLPTVHADPARIEQVLANLLHNAVKFTPTGGEIHLCAEQTGASEVIFRVRDSGAGIAADDLPRIFERFYKADRSRSGGGTGLGLAIARHIVEGHGGRIWVESTPGTGSVFSFTLLVEGSELPH